MSINYDKNYEEQLREMSDILELINYRPRTIESYLRSIPPCLRWWKGIQTQVRQHLQLCHQEIFPLCPAQRPFQQGPADHESGQPAPQGPQPEGSGCPDHGDAESQTPPYACPGLWLCAADDGSDHPPFRGYLTQQGPRHDPRGKQ